MNKHFYGKYEITEAQDEGQYVATIKLCQSIKKVVVKSDALTTLAQAGVTPQTVIHYFVKTPTLLKDKVIVSNHNLAGYLD